MRLLRYASILGAAVLCGCSTLHPAGGFTADSGGAAIHGHRRAIFAAASPGPLEPPAEINCISASVTPCASTSHIGSGNEGEPAWLIFGKLNDWGLQLGLFSNQAANQVVATPNGTSGIPGLRSLVSADLPSALSTVTSVNGTLIPASATLLSSTSNGAVVGSPTVLAAPTQSAPTTSTTGGTLAAGTYYYVVTATTAYGETTASGEQSIATTGTTSENVISWSSVTGATGYRIYRGTAAGAENTYYAVGAVTTYTDTGAAGTAGSPPAVNTTNYQGPGTINSQGCYVNGVSCGGGGSSAFSAITAGTNTSAAMVVGTGASLATSGSGTIAATTSAALATTPTQCTGSGSLATGVAANGNANCHTIAAADLPSSGVTAGSYTSANITVNAQGQVTAATNGSGTGITLQTNGTNNASQTALNLQGGQGIAVTNPSSGNVSIASTVPQRTVTTSPTVASTDMGGLIVMNVTGGGTLTVPAISSTVLASGMSVGIVNYSASTAAVSTTPTINSGGGCVTATGIPSGDSWQLFSNGTTLDCVQTISASSGGGGSTFVNVPSNVTATGPTPVTVLSFSVAANTSYYVECYLLFSEPAGATQIQFTGPATPTSVTYWQPNTGASIKTAFSSLIGFGTETAEFPAQPLVLNLQNGANAGTVALQVQNGTGGDTSTIYGSSYCRVN